MFTYLLTYSYADKTYSKIETTSLKTKTKTSSNMTHYNESLQKKTKVTHSSLISNSNYNYYVASADLLIIYCYWVGI